MDKSGTLGYDIIAKLRIDEESFKKIETRLSALEKPRKINLDITEASAKIDSLLSKLGGLGVGGVGAVGAGSGAIGGAVVGAALGRISNSGVASNVGMGSSNIAPVAAAANVGAAIPTPNAGVYTAPGLPCKNCGAVNPPGAVFCRSCGQNPRGSLTARIFQNTGKALNTAWNLGNGIVDAGFQLTADAAKASNAVLQFGGEMVGDVGGTLYGGIKVGGMIAKGGRRLIFGKPKAPATLDDLMHQNEVSSLASLSELQSIRSTLSNLTAPRRKRRRPRGGGGGGFSVPDSGYASSFDDNVVRTFRQPPELSQETVDDLLSEPENPLAGRPAAHLGDWTIAQRARMTGRGLRLSGGRNAGGTILFDELISRSVAGGAMIGRGIGRVASDIGSGFRQVGSGLASNVPSMGRGLAIAGGFAARGLTAYGVQGIGAGVAYGASVVSNFADDSDLRNRSGISAANARLSGQNYIPENFQEVNSINNDWTNTVRNYLPGVGDLGFKIRDQLFSGKSVNQRLDDARGIDKATEIKRAQGDLRREVLYGANAALSSSQFGLRASIISAAYATRTSPLNQINAAAEQSIIGINSTYDNQSKELEKQKLAEIQKLKDKGLVTSFFLDPIGKKYDDALSNLTKKRDKDLGAVPDIQKDQTERYFSAGSNELDVLKLQSKSTALSGFGYGLSGANTGLDAQIKAIDGKGGAREQALKGVFSQQEYDQINNKFNEQVNQIKIQKSANTFQFQRQIDVQNINTNALRMETAGDPQGALLLRLKASLTADIAANAEPGAIIARGAQFLAERGAALKSIGRTNFLYSEGTQGILSQAKQVGYATTGQGANADIEGIQSEALSAIRSTDPDQPGYQDRIAAIKKLARAKLQGVQYQLMGGGRSAEQVGSYQSHGNVNPYPVNPEDPNGKLKDAQNKIDDATNKDFQNAGMSGGPDWAGIKELLSAIVTNTKKQFVAQ